MATFTPLEAINRLCDKREIFYDEMVDLMRQVMDGKVSHVQLAAILMGLHVKTESVSEIAAAASVMREFSTRVDAADEIAIVDYVRALQLSRAATLDDVPDAARATLR